MDESTASGDFSIEADGSIASGAPWRSAAGGDARPRDPAVRRLLKRAYESPVVPGRMRDTRQWRATRTMLLKEIDGPPQTFFEKVRYRMATDRRPILVTLADKLAVREYVRERVGEEHLTRLYHVATSAGELRDAELPREFVLKATHGSGGVLVVGDHVPRSARLPAPPVGWTWLQAHPDALDRDRLAAVCDEWLGLRYAYGVEWAYSRVTPRIMVEELLAAGGRVCDDYKLYAFGGRVALVHVSHDRFGSFLRGFYTPEWERLDVRLKDYPAAPPLPRPTRLDEIVSTAERLAAGLDFVRVDLYDAPDRVVVGELTIYPGSGNEWFEPREFDVRLGRLWPDPPTRGLRFRPRSGQTASRGSVRNRGT